MVSVAPPFPALKGTYALTGAVIYVQGEVLCYFELF